MKQLFVEAIVKETHTIKHRINVTGISPTKIDDLLKYGDPQENPSDKDHKLSWKEFDHSIVDGSETIELNLIIDEEHNFSKN